eukprot:3088744-Rhodomonas_salina.2
MQQHLKETAQLRSEWGALPSVGAWNHLNTTLSWILTEKLLHASEEEAKARKERVNQIWRTHGWRMHGSGQLTQIRVLPMRSPG